MIIVDINNVYTFNLQIKTAIHDLQNFTCKSSMGILLQNLFSYTQHPFYNTVLYLTNIKNDHVNYNHLIIDIHIVVEIYLIYC